MKNHIPWMILILPVAIALPTEDIDSTDAPENVSGEFEPTVSAKLTNIDTFLQKYDIPNLGSLTSCRSKHERCPFVKEELIKYVENICEISQNAPRSVVDLKDSVTIPTGTGTGQISVIKSKLENKVASASMIYLLLWTYGSSLQSEKFQQFNELYRNVNETFKDYFITINNTLNNDARMQLLPVLHEKAVLDNRFNLIVNDIESNLTKQEVRLNNIVTEIERENYFIAMNKYLGLDDLEFLHTIVEKIVHQKDMITIEKMLKFIKTLQSREDKLAVYDAMLKYDLGYSIFTLEHDFQTTGYSISTDKFMSYTYFRESHVTETRLKEEVAATASKIKILDPLHIQDTIEYAAHQPEYFNAHLGKIMKDIFPGESGKNLDLILTIADNFNQIGQSARVYIKLIQLLDPTRSKHFQLYLKIAAKIKQLTLMKNYINTPREVKEELEVVKQQLPSKVKSIVWGQFCIKNYITLGFLHRNDRCDSSRRNVIITNNPDLWELEISIENQFKIRHNETNEYLYTRTGYLVFMELDGDENLINQFWSFGKLDLQYQSSKDIFYIRNEELGEFLGFKESSDGFVSCKDAITKKDEWIDEYNNNDHQNYYGQNVHFNQLWYIEGSNNC